jgi:hypothetical protein
MLLVRRCSSGDGVVSLKQPETTFSTSWIILRHVDYNRAFRVFLPLTTILASCIRGRYEVVYLCKTVVRNTSIVLLVAPDVK